MVSDFGEITTSIWVHATIRKCMDEGRVVYVINKGAEQRGTIIVKINMLASGCRVYDQIRDLDGNLCWMSAFDQHQVPEEKADDYIRKAIGRDPDVWVVEVEDPEGNMPFDGKIMT